MKFILAGNRVQVQRVLKDEKTGEVTEELVGVMQRDSRRVGAKLRSACTASELAEIEAWIEHQRRLSDLEAEHAAHTLSEQITRATKWLRHADAAEAAQVLEDIKAALPGLRRIVKRFEKSA